MAKDREQSHIMTLLPDNEGLGDRASTETAIESLLEQRGRLVTMLEQIDGDLQSLGYTVNESEA